MLDSSAATCHANSMKQKQPGCFSDTQRGNVSMLHQAEGGEEELDTRQLFLQQAHDDEIEEMNMAHLQSGALLHRACCIVLC